MIIDLVCKMEIDEKSADNSLVFESETNARKLKQLISWAESGSGPGIEKIYDVAKKLFPTHFS